MTPDRREPRRVLVESDPPGSRWRRLPPRPSFLERHPTMDRAVGVAAVVGGWTGRVAWAIVQAVLPG